MKKAFVPEAEVVQIPGKDTFMVRTSYTSNGPTFTLSNGGEGYLKEDAENLANAWLADMRKNRFNIKS